MCFVQCLQDASLFVCCVYLSLWVFGSFVPDLQGLWTEAHQYDRAPQWQLPPPAGPWPVPRCLRRWSSLNTHCFLCTVKAVNTAAIQWTDPQFFGCGPRPSRPSVCTRASAVAGDSSTIFVFCCWIAPDCLPVTFWRFTPLGFVFIEIHQHQRQKSKE